MPLIAELWDDKKQSWDRVKELVPGDPPAGITSYSLLGGSKMYFVECDRDDERTSIFKASPLINTDLTRGLRSTLATGLLHIKDLGHEDTHELLVLPPKQIAPVRMRLRHLTIDFGTRHCPLCNQDIPGQKFGMHTGFEHSDVERAAWPGGSSEYLATLSRSIEESIERANGFPIVTKSLKASLEAIKTSERRAKAHLN